MNADEQPPFAFAALDLASERCAGLSTTEYRMGLRMTPLPHPPRNARIAREVPGSGLLHLKQHPQLCVGGVRWAKEDDSPRFRAMAGLPTHYCGPWHQCCAGGLRR